MSMSSISLLDPQATIKFLRRELSKPEIRAKIQRVRDGRAELIARWSMGPEKQATFLKMEGPFPGIDNLALSEKLSTDQPLSPEEEKAIYKRIDLRPGFISRILIKLGISPAEI